ncbi:hypothetical protein HK096_003260 [Nowakowskiella sp. JEL0078]|nr:hypothetical protein HK096_003260 [Nowakowskiella sp. JEL0078]
MSKTNNSDKSQNFDKASSNLNSTGGVTMYHVVVVALLALLVGSQYQQKISSPLDDVFIKKLEKIITQSLFVSTTSCNSSNSFPFLKKRFTHDDFETYFGLNYTPTVLIDPLIEPYIRAHDTTLDSYYSLNPSEGDRWAQHLGNFLENGFPDDERFYIEFISPAKGYGLFANVKILPKQVVALYAGIITNNSLSDYQWDYPSNITDSNGEPLNLGVDSRFTGNWARFVNHADDPNLDSLYVVYMSTKFIDIGEEVTISYGDAYWTSREVLEKID